MVEHKFIDGDISKGIGGAVGGGGKATPVAVVVVDGENVRIEAFGK